MKQTLLNIIWDKAQIISGEDPDKYRLDIAGALICKNEYGKTTNYGWRINYVFPETDGGLPVENNLIPLHWENDKSKGFEFPSFNTVITSIGRENIPFQQSFAVSGLLHPIINWIYKP